MRSFSALINKLLLTSSRNRKVDVLCDYFKNTPDPDRGFTLAIITNSLEIKNIPISKIKEIVRGERRKIINILPNKLFMDLRN